MKEKIVSFDELIKKTKELRKQGKKIVQSHGVYDIIHPGIIQHLNLAKKQGDVLIVTVIRDKHVRLGPGRPLFNEQLRLDNVTALAPVDFVSLVDENVPFECIRLLKPDIFAKGRAVRERDQVVHGNLFESEKEANFGKTKIFETEGFTFHTQQLVNNFMSSFPEETKEYLADFSSRHSFKGLAAQLNKLKDLKVLLIGDGIIDEYHYCDAMGRSSKAHLVVNRFVNFEVFAGGVFALANHLSSICDKIKLVTLLGENDTREKFISKNLRPNVDSKFFYRENSPTIVKKRYLNNYSSQKLFEVNYLDDHYVDGKQEKEIMNYLNDELPNYDIVLVSDFGHGFITDAIIELIRRRAKKYAVNTQTNAANTGYNLITKYQKPYFICVDEGELRLAAQEKHASIETVAKTIKRKVAAQYLIVTLGKNGSLGIGPKNYVSKAPIFSTKVVDTIGAGDAFFAFTAPCFGIGMPLDLVSFIGNIVGTLAVQIVGNKKPVEKYEVLEFAHNLLRR